MTADEAIKSLGLKVNNPNIDTRDIQLGIEALEERKRIRKLVISRQKFGDTRGYEDILAGLKQLLLSETEEGP